MKIILYEINIKDKNASYKFQSKALDDGVWREWILKKIDAEDKNSLKNHVAFVHFKQRNTSEIFSEDKLWECECKRDLPKVLQVSSNALENHNLNDEIIFNWKMKIKLETSS